MDALVASLMETYIACRVCRKTIALIRGKHVAVSAICMFCLELERISEELRKIGLGTPHEEKKE